MKRLLAIFTLMLLMATPQLASAAPFAYGPVDGSNASIFDTDKGLLENLQALDEAVSGGSWLFEASLDDFSNSTFKFAGLGYSGYVASYDLTVYNGTTPVGSVMSGFDIADEAALTDLYIEYYDTNLGDLERVALTDLVMTVLQLGGNMEFTLDGTNYAFTEGIFFGFSIPGSGNNIDFILGGVPYGPSAVPVPAAVWLFGTGLAGLYAVRKRSN